MDVETSFKVIFRATVPDRMLVKPERFTKELGEVLYRALKKFVGDINMEITELNVVKLVETKTGEEDA